MCCWNEEYDPHEDLRGAFVEEGGGPPITMADELAGGLCLRSNRPERGDPGRDRNENLGD